MPRGPLHCYFTFRGKLSEWVDGVGPDSRGRWSASVTWSFGEDAADDVQAAGAETEDGWALEVRLSKAHINAVADLPLAHGATVGLNVGIDDDDARGPEGTSGSAERTKDLEVQYGWANRTLDPDQRLTHAATGEAIFVGGPPLGVEFRRGDSNADGSVDLSDAVFTLGALFLGTEDPTCEKAADADDTGELELTDAIYTLDSLFTGGPEPPAPFPNCGLDDTEDELSCESYEAEC